MFRTSDFLGNKICNHFRQWRDILIFTYLTFRQSFLLRWPSFLTVLYNLVSQINFTGLQALPLMSFLALIVGSIIVLQTTAQLSLIGSQEMMGNILVVTIMRELGPLLTALIVIARSGSAVASELGNMQVNNEFESLRAMSIEPLSYVVFPRIMGGVISLVSLAFYFNVIAFLGGFIVAHYLSDLSFEFYLDVVSNSITFGDFSQNIIKNAACGLIIFSIATYHGLKVKNAAFEVPIASTKSVVNSIIAVMVFNLLMTIYHLRGGII